MDMPRVNTDKIFLELQEVMLYYISIKETKNRYAGYLKVINRRNANA